jgi:hypothetical protein
MQDFYSHFPLNNWTSHRDTLLAHWKENGRTEPAYIEYDNEQLSKLFPDLVTELAQHNLTPWRLFFLGVIPCFESHTDPTDPLTPFIHTDMPDNDGDPVPKWALNIPLENYEDSWTVFYKLKDPYQPWVLYGNWSATSRGHDPRNCEEVTRVQLKDPMLFKVDGPHAVVSNTEKLRLSVSIRF